MYHYFLIKLHKSNPYFFKNSLTLYFLDNYLMQKALYSMTFILLNPNANSSGLTQWIEKSSMKSQNFKLLYCDSLLMLFALKCVSPKDVRFWILLKRGALNESDDTAESHQCIWGRKSSIYEKCAFCKSGWKKKYLIVWTVCSAQSLMLICACMKPFSGIETSRWGICRK